MKKRIQLTKNSLIGLSILFGFLGAALAVLTYFRFAYIARGVVGLATIYLFIKGRPDNLSEPIQMLLQRKNKIGDLLSLLVSTLILTWAGLQIVQVYLHYVLGK
jgi:hypothetical protein